MTKIIYNLFLIVMLQQSDKFCSFLTNIVVSTLMMFVGVYFSIKKSYLEQKNLNVGADKISFAANYSTSITKKNIQKIFFSIF